MAERLALPSSSDKVFCRLIRDRWNCETAQDDTAGSRGQAIQQRPVMFEPADGMGFVARQECIDRLDEQWQHAGGMRCNPHPTEIGGHGQHGGVIVIAHVCLRHGSASGEQRVRNPES